jgi:hypothetical protein
MRIVSLSEKFERANNAQHTSGHVECPACLGAIMRHNETLSPGLTFAEAFEIWIEKRTLKSFGLKTDAHYFSERTEWDYRQYARALNKFFGMRLRDIHCGHFVEYQRGRALCDKKVGNWDRQANTMRIPLAGCSDGCGAAMAPALRSTPHGHHTHGGGWRADPGDHELCRAT